MKKILLVLLIILVSASSAFCGAFEDTLKKAEQGDASAQYYLGLTYDLGQGVTQDYKQAAYWYTKAAEQGLADAQFSIGWMYTTGQGVLQDNKQAAHWFTEAAEQGLAEAQYNLGVMYRDGQGVPQNYKQAVHWFTEAAEQEHAEAQYNLGVMYNFGQGVTQDYKQALYWYTKVAEQGLAEAQYNLGVMYANGQGVTQDNKQAAHWFTEAGEQGLAEAQYNLGVMYANGQGVTQNYRLAYVWWSLVAAQGHEGAINNRDMTAKKLSPHQLSEAQDLAAKIQHKIDNPVKQGVSAVANPTPSYRRAPTSTSAEVRWVQQTLKSLGYDPGPVDGVMGAQTRGAIIAFQTDIGVAPTGVIDEALVAQLRKAKTDQTADTEKMVSGTGFFITTDGYILTCLHVVEGAARLEIYVGDKMYPASLIRSDPNNDLAVLKINGSFQALAFSPHRSAKMGQDVFTVGFPNPGLQGVSAKYTKGTVSSLTGFQDDLRLYQVSVPIQPGNSGGALLDEHGNILGVVIAMLNAKKTFEISGSLPQNVNYAVKSLYAQAMIDTLPDVAENLISPSRSKSNAIENAQNSTVMVVCYE